VLVDRDHPRPLGFSAVPDQTIRYTGTQVSFIL
jgi:hypothetical protein